MPFVPSLLFPLQFLSTIWYLFSVLDPRSPLVLFSCVFVVLAPALRIGCVPLLQLGFPPESVQGQRNENFAFSVEYKIVNNTYLLSVVFVILRGQDVSLVQSLSTAPFLKLHAVFRYCLRVVSRSSSQGTQYAVASRKCFTKVMKRAFTWDSLCSVTWQGCNLRG